MRSSCTILFSAVVAVSLVVASASAFDFPAVPPSCNGVPNKIPIHDASNATLIATHPFGKLLLANPGPDEFRILHMYGKTPYQNGLAHGALLKNEINAVLPMFTTYIEQQINASVPDLPPKLLKFIATFGLDAALDLTIEWTKPFTPDYYIEELHGLAAGANVSFGTAYRLLMVPELTKAACTVVGAGGLATPTGTTHQLRALDVGLYPVLNFPLLSIYHFSKHPYGANTRDTAVFGWILLNVGALTGFSSGPSGGESLSIGEKVLLKYGDSIDGVKGTPWMMLLRDVLAQTDTVEKAVAFLRAAKRTCAIHVGVGGSDGEFQGIEQAEKLFKNYTWETLGSWPGHPLIPGVFYWNKHAQPSHAPCLGDLLTAMQPARNNSGLLHGNITALNLVQVASIGATGNLHAVTMDLQQQVAFFANARKDNVTTGSINAFARQFSRVNLRKLFDEEQ